MSGSVSQPGKVIAQPSGACCLGGNIHEGEPRGTMTSVAGIETYFTDPPAEKANGHILVYFPGVHGFFNNAFLIMDAFADAVAWTTSEGCDPVSKHRKYKGDTTTDPGFDYEAWKAKHKAFSDEATPRWVAEVKAKYGKAETKITCVGYCYGAPYVCDELAEVGNCTAGAFAHPAFLKESHFLNLERPLFLSCAEIDHTFPNQFRNRAVDILQERKKDFQVQVFSGVQHGFALRGDINNSYERYTKEQSVRGIAD